MSRFLLSLAFAGVISFDPVAQSGNAPVTGGDHLRIWQSLDAEWAFHRGEAPGAEQPAYDDRVWRRLDVPHDCRIEDVPVDDPGRPPVLALVPGAWRFHEGDDPAWKDSRTSGEELDSRPGVVRRCRTPAEDCRCPDV